MTGTISRIAIARGFGFISADDGGPDVFFHMKDCDPGLPFDEALIERHVEFNTTPSDKGLRANSVRPSHR